MNDYDIGLITRDEMDELIGESTYRSFARAKRRFKGLYGYYPVKVPRYEIGVFKTPFMIHFD